MRTGKTEVLTVDIGNTSAFFVYFSGQKIKKFCRIPTAALDSSAIGLIQKKFSIKRIQTVVIASVVPWAGLFLRKEIPRRLGLKTYLIGKDLAAPIVNRYKSPKQVGVDRLANAVAAYHRYHRDIIVIDFGTAITFDVVSRKGEYLGGVIAPGIEISLEALYQKTALLPKIRLSHPKHLIGRDTAESIRVGCSTGIGGLCDRIVERVSKRYFLKPLVIATGGYAYFMRRYCESIHKIEPTLTVRGILLSYKKFLTNKSRPL